MVAERVNWRAADTRRRSLSDGEAKTKRDGNDEIGGLHQCQRCADGGVDGRDP